MEKHIKMSAGQVIKSILVSKEAAEAASFAG